MYEELASVRGVVDLTPEAALDEAETFLAGLGYMTVQRTDARCLQRAASPAEKKGRKPLS